MRKASDDESAFSHTASKVERQKHARSFAVIIINPILLKIMVFNTNCPEVLKKNRAKP